MRYKCLAGSACIILLFTVTVSLVLGSMYTISFRNKKVGMFWRMHNYIFETQWKDASANDDSYVTTNKYNIDKSELLKDRQLFEKEYFLPYSIHPFDFTIEQIVYFQRFYKPGLVSYNIDNQKYKVFDDADNRLMWDDFFEYLNSIKVEDTIMAKARHMNTAKCDVSERKFPWLIPGNSEDTILDEVDRRP